MKVILQKNVQSLGKAGDVVESAPGYYRNYLQPRGLAVMATDGAMKKREEDLEQIRQKSQKQHESFVALAEQINNLGSIKLTAKAGEGGRLYGKVTNKEIAEQLKAAIGHDVDKRAIKTDEDISALGTYKATVKLAPDVQAHLNVEVAQQ